MLRPYQTDHSQLIKLSTLPVGTQFYVESGAWAGEIILIDGKKGLRVNEAGREFVFDADHREPELEVTVLQETERENDPDDGIPY